MIILVKINAINYLIKQYFINLGYLTDEVSDLRPNSEVADGVHWIKDRFVNTYIIEIKDDLVLIDAGMDKKAKLVLQYVANELESKNIEKILLTHGHGDHIGGLYHIYHAFKPRIFVSKEDEQYVSGKKKRPLPQNKLYAPLFYTLRFFSRTKPVTQLEIVKDWDTIDDFTAHHLPGHTMGSLGFLRNNILFSGDAGITKKGEVRLSPSFFGEFMDIAASSLKKMSLIDFDMLLPGHGEPILEEASLRVKDAITKLTKKNN